MKKINEDVKNCPKCGAVLTSSRLLVLGDLKTCLKCKSTFCISLDKTNEINYKIR